MSPVHHPPRDHRSLSRTLTLPPTPTSTRNLRPHPAPLAALPSRREALVASSVALVVPLLVPPASSAAPPGFKKDLSKGRKDKIPRDQTRRDETVLRHMTPSAAFGLGREGRREKRTVERCS